MHKKVLFFMLILAIFFPPVSTYLAMKSSWENKENDRIREEMIQIKQGFQQIENGDFLGTETLKSISQIQLQDGQNLTPPHERLKSGEMEKSLCALVEEFLKNSKQKVQVILLIDYGSSIKSIPFGPEFGLTQIMDHFSNSGFMKNGIREPEPACKAKYLIPDDEILRNFGMKRSKRTVNRITVRNQSCIRSIAYLFVNLYAQIVFLIDNDPLMPNLLLRDTLGKISSKICFGAIDKENGQLTFPRSLTLKSSELKVIRKKLANWHQLPEAFYIGDYKVILTPDDVRQSKRFFAIIKQRQPFKSSSPLVALLFLASCTLSIIISERMFFGRGPDVSLKFLIPVMFIFIVIQPVFASFYYLEDYFYTSYISQRNQVYQELFQKLKTLDMETFDNFKQTVDTVRGLGSLEKIMDYVSYYNRSDIQGILFRLMKKLRGNRVIRYNSLWYAAENGEFNKCQWDSDTKQLRSDMTTANPISDVFRNRFQEIVRYKKYGKTKIEEPDKVDKNALKNDLAREFLVSVVGPDSFFEFRKYSEFIISAKSTYSSDFIICVPISYKGTPYGFIAWHIESTKIEGSFPREKLSINNDSPVIALTGNEKYYLGHPLPINELQKKFPELTQLAIDSTNSRSRLTKQIHFKDGYLVIDAIPANYSYLTLAGSLFLESFEALKSKITGSLGPKIAVAILFGILGAWLSALYIIYPIQELTLGTREIENGNFSVRIDQEHPDDFAEIGLAFNTMARRLDEGKILKGFVSESVLKEVAQHDGGKLSEKAEQKRATIIFSALSNFKELLASNDAEKVFALLQQHLEAGVNATAKFGGEIDKMIEDKLMIVFEHDSESENYCQAAIHVASEINSQLKQKTGFATVAGINSGLTVAGIMGAEKARLARTVVGDPVNLAARLAAEASLLGGDSIVVSEEVSQNIPVGFLSEKLPITKVKGKTHSISAFRVFKGA